MRFILLLSLIFGFLFADEDLIRQSASQGYHEEFIDLVELIPNIMRQLQSPDEGGVFATAS